jgi:hypothetical protein
VGWEQVLWVSCAVVLGFGARAASHLLLIQSWNGLQRARNVVFGAFSTRAQTVSGCEGKAPEAVLCCRTQGPNPQFALPRGQSIIPSNSSLGFLMTEA